MASISNHINQANIKKKVEISSVEGKVKHYFLKGTYSFFSPCLLPGVLYFVSALSSGSNNYTQLILLTFYASLALFIFKVKPIMVLCENDIRTNWFSKVHKLKAEDIEKIVCYGGGNGNVKSIHIHKKKRRSTLMISMVFGWNANHAYPHILEFAKRHDIDIVN